MAAGNIPGTKLQLLRLPAYTTLLYLCASLTETIRMMRYIILLTLLFPLALHAQQHLGKSRQALTDEMLQLSKKNPQSKAEFDNQRNRLLLTTKDSLGHTLYYEYGFDEQSGACITEMIKADCESCIRNAMNRLLSYAAYEWKKINESQYVSRFEDYLLIEWQQSGNDFSFTLIKTAWTRELYNLMKEK